MALRLKLTYNFSAADTVILHTQDMSCNSIFKSLHMNPKRLQTPMT